MEIQIDETGPYVVAAVTGTLTAQHAEAFTERLQGFVQGDGAIMSTGIGRFLAGFWIWG